MRPGRRWSGGVAARALCGCGIIERARDPYASAPSTAERPWTPPPDALPPPAAVPGLRITPTRARGSALPALIDLAQRANPATRLAWEQARAAATRLGLTESAWLPVL